MVAHLGPVPARTHAELQAAAERWSTLATSFAVVIGSRSTIRQMPLATRILRVASAAAVSATKRSYVRQYLAGNGCPARGRSPRPGCGCAQRSRWRCSRAPRPSARPRRAACRRRWEVSEPEFHTPRSTRHAGLPPRAPPLSPAPAWWPPARRSRPPGAQPISTATEDSSGEDRTPVVVPLSAVSPNQRRSRATATTPAAGSVQPSCRDETPAELHRGNAGPDGRDGNVPAGCWTGGGGGVWSASVPGCDVPWL